MERDGKKPRVEKEEDGLVGDDGSSAEDTDSSEEEGDDMRMITEKLAQANILIEEAEIGGYENKENVQKAGELFQSVITANKDQIEGAIFGKYDEADSFMQKAMAINPQDDRVEEVLTQIKDMKDGKKQEKVHIPNLIDNNTLSARFVEVLQEIFTRFDKNNDGALNPTELDAFTKVVNGQPIDKQTLKFMKTNLSWSSKGLTQEGFFELYVTQTIGDVNETWDDLEKLGYNKNLEKI